MTNVHLPGYPKHGEYRKTTLQLVSSDGKQTVQPLKSESTQPGGFGGGGDDMENRLTILERDFEHTKGDIGDIKSNIREIRNSIWGIVFVGLAAIGGLYVYIDNKTDQLRIEIKSDFKEVHSELKELNKDVTTIKSDISSIKSSIEKLAKDK